MLVADIVCGEEMLYSFHICLSAFLGFVKNIYFSNRRHFFAHNHPIFVATVTYFHYISKQCEQGNNMAYLSELMRMSVRIYI